MFSLSRKAVVVIVSVSGDQRSEMEIKIFSYDTVIQNAVDTHTFSNTPWEASTLSIRRVIKHLLKGRKLPPKFACTYSG